MSSTVFRRFAMALFVFSPHMFGQRTTGAYIPSADQGTEVRNTDLWDDRSVETPHSIFERLERSYAKNSSPPPVSTVSPAGTVSVDELRHPLSGKGERLIQKGQSYVRAGERGKAIEQFKEALNEPSSAPYAHGLLGVEYLKSGELSTAIVELSEAVRMMPLVAANHSNLGYAFCMTGKRDAAERELREAIRLDQAAPRPHYLLGLLLLDRQSPDAEAYLRFAKTVVRGAHLALAIFHFRYGEFDAARQDVRAYLGSEELRDPAGAERWLMSAAKMDRPSLLFGFSR